MKIGKVFEIAYAHRLMNHSGKCKNLHGHSGRIEIQIESEINPDTNMVMDFGDIAKEVIYKVDFLLDHSTILYKDDPLVETLYTEGFDNVISLNYHPTAEILSSLVHRLVMRNLESLCLFNCVVRFWETGDSYAECSDSLEGIIDNIGLKEELAV